LQILRAWDERGHAFRNTYDKLQRTLVAYLTPSGGSEIAVGVSLYGDVPGTSGSSTYYNLRGQLVRQATNGHCQIGASGF